MAETFNPITFVNDSTPALNATNLNATQQGIKTVDTRVAKLELGVDTPVAVSYAASVTINATQGSLFRINATGNLTITDITGGTDGQEVTIEVLAVSADRILSFTGGTPATVTVSAGQVWTETFRYRQAIDSWVYTGDVAAGSSSGAAGGVLAGTYPNPSFAVDMATQAELDTAIATRAASAHTHAATDLSSGTIATARLGSGTANSTTFLRGDSTWGTPSGSGGGYDTIQDEGVARTQRSALNFTGNGVVVTDNATLGRTDVAISGTSVSTPWTYVAPGSSVQAAINGGAKAIQLGAGNYDPFSLLGTATAHTRIQGVGMATVIIPSGAVNACITVGDGTDAGKTWGINISDLVCDANGVATHGIDWNIQAASQSTTGFYQGEPDSMCRMDNVWSYDAQQVGIYQRGLDLQAMIASRCRSRRAGTYGWWLNCPDCWWHHNEATGGNATGAAWRVEGANTFFSANKAWFADNYGFWMRATRCRVTNCESQDNASHGFFVDFAKVSFMGCTADQNGYNGGTDNTVDGFNVSGSTSTNPVQMVGCQSFNRMASTEVGQRYGFNIPASMQTDGFFVANAGFANKTALLNVR